MIHFLKQMFQIRQGNHGKTARKAHPFERIFGDGTLLLNKTQV
mgnify:CR=1 FL=1